MHDGGSGEVTRGAIDRAHARAFGGLEGDPVPLRRHELVVQSLVSHGSELVRVRGREEVAGGTAGDGDPDDGPWHACYDTVLAGSREEEEGVDSVR